MRCFVPALLSTIVLAGCSLSGSGPAAKDTSESLVTVTSITDAGNSASAITSDVSVNSSDLAKVTFQNITKSSSITDPSQLFGVTLTRVRVTFSRSDGGPPPAPFQAGMSLFVPPPSTATTPTPAKGTTTTTTTTTTSPGMADTEVVVVQAAMKGTPPLSDLESGKSISASATLTFDGQDGLGRAVSVTGGIALTFVRPAAATSP